MRNVSIQLRIVSRQVPKNKDLSVRRITKFKTVVFPSRLPINQKNRRTKVGLFRLLNNFTRTRRYIRLPILTPITGLIAHVKLSRPLLIQNALSSMRLQPRQRSSLILPQRLLLRGIRVSLRPFLILQNQRRNIRHVTISLTISRILSLNFHMNRFTSPIK